MKPRFIVHWTHKKKRGAFRQEQFCSAPVRSFDEAMSIASERAFHSIACVILREDANGTFQLDYVYKGR